MAAALVAAPAAAASEPHRSRLKMHGRLLVGRWGHTSSRLSDSGSSLTAATAAAVAVAENSAAEAAAAAALPPPPLPPPVASSPCSSVLYSYVHLVVVGAR